VTSTLTYFTSLKRDHYACDFNSTVKPEIMTDHLRIATSCRQRPLLMGPDFNVYSIKTPLNNDLMTTTPYILGSSPEGSLVQRFNCITLFSIIFSFPQMT